MFGFWHAMELICNLLKLTIISKFISRLVELYSVEQKLVAIDDEKCNNESTTLGCHAVDYKRKDE
jgi:hypothetical protein